MSARAWWNEGSFCRNRIYTCCMKHWCEAESPGSSALLKGRSAAPGCEKSMMLRAAFECSWACLRNRGWKCGPRERSKLQMQAACRESDPGLLSFTSHENLRSTRISSHREVIHKLTLAPNVMKWASALSNLFPSAGKAPDLLP